MSKNIKNHFLLHFVVFLWGFTAVLGKLISISALPLVWYRFVIAIAVIFIYLKITRQNLRLQTKSLLKLFGVGFVIALHWVTFYLAIKVSNVSVTLVSLSSGTLFTALLEPLFFKRRVHFHELIFGVIIILGIGFIFKLETGYELGFSVALLSAFSSSLFLVINGKIVNEYDPTVMSFYEMIGGFLGLSFFILTSGVSRSVFVLPPTADFMWLLILGVACTAFAFVASTHVMKKISPFTVMIAIMMEPIYGILLARFIFGTSEQMTPGFYLGAIVILATILANAATKKRLQSLR